MPLAGRFLGAKTASPVDGGILPGLFQNSGLCLFALSLPLSVSGANAGWVLLALALGLSAESRRESLARLRVEPLLWPWVLYLAAAVLSRIFGIDYAGTWYALKSDLVKAFVYFVLAFSLAVPRSRGQARAEADWDRAESFYLAGAALAALLGIVQVVWGYFLSGRIVIADGTMHHVTYGEGLSLAFCFCLAKFLFAREKREKTWLAAVLILLNLGLILSQARGSWLATAANLSGMLVLWPPGRKAVLAVCAANLFLFAAVFWLGPRFALASSLRSRTSSIVSTSFGPNQTRFLSWRVGWLIFKDHPAFGVGSKNLGKIFYKYHPEPVEGKARWSNLHSLYMQQLAERGAVGLVALLFLLACMFRLAWGQFRSGANAQRLCALAALPGFFVLNLTETSFQHAIPAFTALWLLVLARAHHPVPSFLPKVKDFEEGEKMRASLREGFV